MGILELVYKQMRQRALSTWLTLLSVLLGVGLATAILLFQREGAKLFGQTDFGYDLIIGPKGDKLQLVLNTAYHLSESSGTIPYSYYEEFPANLPEQYRGPVEWKVPYAVGDNYKGYRIIATTPALFGVDENGKQLPAGKRPEYRIDRSFELAQGRVFHPRKFEAILGSEVAKKSGLKLGSKFRGEHGTGAKPMDEDEHEEQWEVVGILKQTHTANDRALFIPLVSFYAIPAHEKGLEELANVSGAATKPAATEAQKKLLQEGRNAPSLPSPGVPGAGSEPASKGHAGHDHEEPYEMNPDGTINLKLPKSEWRISAFLVRSAGAWSMRLQYAVNNGDVAMAVIPAQQMKAFFKTFLKGSTDLLLLVAFLVNIVAAVSILVSIYNSITARRKEIAILRALGATRRRVVAIICLEAAIIGLVGGIGGIIIGHLLGAGGSVYLQSLLGEGIAWLTFGTTEGLYLAAVVVLAVLAGLVPAIAAYKTPVATNLVAT